SPRETTWLPLELMLSAIDQAADLGYRVVVFTGGEPTLAGRDLLTAIDRAATHGMVVRIVTNCYWAAKRHVARRRVQTFVDAGLNEINFSTGDQHTRFVPLDNVIRATHASLEAGLRTIVIMVETLRERAVTRETIIQHPGWKKLRADFPSVAPIIH